MLKSRKPNHFLSSSRKLKFIQYNYATNLATVISTSIKNVEIIFSISTCGSALWNYLTVKERYLYLSWAAVLIKKDSIRSRFTEKTARFFKAGSLFIGDHSFSVRIRL